MRNIAATELQDHIADLQAGHRLTVVHGGKPLAEIIPISTSSSGKTEYPKKWASEKDRLAAVDEFMAFLEKGIDLGGLKINRDELYDRD